MVDFDQKYANMSEFGLRFWAKTGMSGFEAICADCGKTQQIKGPSVIELMRKKFTQQGWKVDKSEQVCPACRKERKNKPAIPVFGIPAQPLPAFTMPSVILDTPVPNEVPPVLPILTFKVRYSRRRNPCNNMVKHNIWCDTELWNKIKAKDLFFTVDGNRFIYISNKNMSCISTSHLEKASVRHFPCQGIWRECIQMYHLEHTLEDVSMVELNAELIESEEGVLMTITQPLVDTVKESPTPIEIQKPVEPSVLGKTVIFESKLAYYGSGKERGAYWLLIKNPQEVGIPLGTRYNYNRQRMNSEMVRLTFVSDNMGGSKLNFSQGWYKLVANVPVQGFSVFGMTPIKIKLEIQANGKHSLTVVFTDKIKSDSLVSVYTEEDQITNEVLVPEYDPKSDPKFGKMLQEVLGVETSVEITEPNFGETEMHAGEIVKPVHIDPSDMVGSADEEAEIAEMLRECYAEGLKEEITKLTDWLRLLRKMLVKEGVPESFVDPEGFIQSIKDFDPPTRIFLRGFDNKMVVPYRMHLVELHRFVQSKNVGVLHWNEERKQFEL